MKNPRQAAEAVHHILTALEASLRDGHPLPESYANLCADRFASFVASSKAWRGSLLQLDAYEEFAVLSAKVSDLDRLGGTAARLSEPRLRRIGHGFCVSFELAGHSVVSPTAIPEILEVSASSPERLLRIPRQSWSSPSAERVVSVAENGAPGALCGILKILVSALQGARTMPCSYVSFCADSLRTLLDNSKAWEAISRGDASMFGRAVCRAFHLSKSQATRRQGEYPKHVLTCPPAVLKFEQLLLHGISWRAATSIILAAFQTPRHRSLEDWLTFLEVQAVQDETLGQHQLIEHRFELADQVERAMTSRRNREQAYLVVARNLACKLFPDTRTQWKRWASRILRDSQRRRRASDQVKLARVVRAAIDQDRRLPPVPKALAERVLPKVQTERTTTRLSESAVRELLPAVRDAHRSLSP